MTAPALKVSALALWVAATGAAQCLAADSAPAESLPTESQGNVDGVLLWRLGRLEPGGAASRTLLLAWGQGRDEVERTLAKAGRAALDSASAARTTVGASVASAPAALWVENGSTDLALEADGAFFWEAGGRQALRGKQGGQLSRLAYWLRYRSGGEARCAGVRIASAPRLEGLSVTRPAWRTAAGTIEADLASTDGAVSMRVVAGLGVDSGAAGVPAAFLRLEVSNVGSKLVDDLEVSFYSNLEAAHDSENDVAFLAAGLGVATYDARQEVLCVMAGLEPPASGWVGTWPSEEALVSGRGLAAESWPAFPDLARLAPPFPTIATAHPGAPRVRDPVEPPTQSLSAGEARKALERDWIFQAQEEPLRGRALSEIGWARQLVRRFVEAGATGLVEPIAELELLELALRAPDAGSPERGRQLYLAVRAAKRRIVFSNPALDFTSLVAIDQPNPQGSEWQHQARHRNGFMAVSGGRLLLLEGLSPGGAVRKLAALPPGAYWKPDLSFDARHVAFAYKASDEESFHLWEVGIDGTGLRRLTEGPHDDLDPVYLPGGGFAFVTTRGETYVRCMPYTRSNVLARCDADGANIRFLSVNSEPDWHPIVLPDGRFLFSRWEYQDKALWRIMSLWTVRPDGTQMESFWGNQSVWPDHPTEARPIPGTEKVIFTGTAHHDYFSGSIGILDPSLGLNYPHGLTKVTWELAWPESGDGPAERIHDPEYHASGRFVAYKAPFPITERDFLVSARPEGERWKLYLMDVSGNRELLHEGAFNCWYPIPVRPVPPPAAIADRTEWPAPGDARAPGRFFSADVLQGVEGLPRERVKLLRVIRSDYKTYTLWARDYRFEGPAVSLVQADSVKWILGTVPVEADGSVYFEAPSGVPLHFQLLDGEKRALHTMRSFTGLMPGETRGCHGCHEGQHGAPGGQGALALSRPPRRITPPPWGDATIGYERLVQPVLDRRCGSCHEGDGAGKAALDLTLRPGEGPFQEPYVTLIRSGLAGVIPVEGYDQRDPASYATYPPLKSLSATSRLIELAASGQHHEVKVEGAELEQLIGWVDAMAPYRGLEEIRELEDPRCSTAPVVLRP